MSIDLKSLELFARIAAVGAIGKAGAEFGLSPTAATHRIQALETAVGAQLLHRTTRTVSLSAEGEVFLEHAKRLLAGLDDALSDVRGEPHTIHSILRVASSASFGRKHIAPLMAGFLAAHPKLSVQMHFSDSVFDIVEHGYDLAIRLGELAPSTLQARKIGASPRIVVASPDYLERSARIRSPDDLSHHNCLIRDDLRSWKFRGPDGRNVEVKIDGNYCTNLAEAVTEGAISGVGVARKCAWEVTDDLRAGRLVTVLDDHTILPEWNIYAVRPPSSQVPRRVRLLTEYLEARFRDSPELAPG